MQQCPSLVAEHISNTPDSLHKQSVENQKERKSLTNICGFGSGGEDDGSIFLMLWCWKGAPSLSLLPQPMQIGCCCFWTPKNDLIIYKLLNSVYFTDILIFSEIVLSV